MSYYRYVHSKGAFGNGVGTFTLYDGSDAYGNQGKSEALGAYSKEYIDMTREIKRVLHSD